MADQGCIFQLEGIDYGGEIVCQRIEIIPAPRIAGSAMPAAIVGNTSESLLGERLHLVSPHSRAKSPTRKKEQRLTAPPVAVEQCDVVGCADQIWI